MRHRSLKAFFPQKPHLPQQCRLEQQQSAPEMPAADFWYRYLRKIWVKSQMSGLKSAQHKPKKRVLATKCDSRQDASKWDIAHATTKESNHHISLFCDTIYLFHWSFNKWKFQYGRVCLVTIHILSLWLKQQYLSALSYSKLTLMANGADVCTMSVI